MHPNTKNWNSVAKFEKCKICRCGKNFYAANYKVRSCSKSCAAKSRQTKVSTPMNPPAVGGRRDNIEG